MSQTLSSFWQTLVTAASEASQALVGPNAYLDAIFMDYKPEAASIGQTLNVPIPMQVGMGAGGVQDAGVADPVFTDISFTTAAIVFNQHPAFNYVIRDFEQFNSSQLIRQIFLDAALKGVAEYIDATVATNCFTSAAMNVNAVQSTTGSLVTTAQFLSAQALLLSQRVQTADVQNMTFIQHPIPWTKLMGNADWTQQSIASELIAERVRMSGEISTSYGATICHDLFTPTSGSVGSRSFTGSYFHRWAVALATRPLPPPDAKVADFTYTMYKGIPIRIVLAWSVVHNGYCVLVEAGFGYKVVRPNMAVLFATAE